MLHFFLFHFSSNVLAVFIKMKTILDYLMGIWCLSRIASNVNFVIPIHIFMLSMGSARYPLMGKIQGLLKFPYNGRSPTLPKNGKINVNSAIPI